MNILLVNDINRFLKRNKKYKPIHIEVCLILILVIISSSIFFYNLENSTFFRDDEYYLTHLMVNDITTLLINYRENSFGTSSTFLPLIFLSKPFFFINSFPSYRYITSFYSVIGVLIAYFTVRMITKSYFKAFLASLIFSTNQYIVLLSHVFMVDALILLFTSLVIYFYFKWERSKKTIYLIAMFVFLAIDVYNHGSAYFLVASLILWLILLILMRKLKLKQFIIGIVIFLFIMIPCLRLLYNDIKYDMWFVKKQYIRLGIKYSGIDPTINLYNFNDLVLTPLSDLFNEFFNDLNICQILFLALFLFTLVSYILGGIKDEYKFLIFMTISAFLLKIISVPSGNTTHYLPFFILFIFSLTQNLEFKGKKSFFLIVIVFILIFGFINLNEILDDKYTFFQSKIPETSRLIIQNPYGNPFMYDIFNYLDYGEKYNLTYYDCGGSESMGIIGNETFDRLKQFSSGDVIITKGKWCGIRPFDNRLLEKLEPIKLGRSINAMNIYKVK
jgi:hypothetical protein